MAIADRLEIRLDLDLAERLKAEARRTGESKAGVIRRLLEQGLPGKEAT